MMDQYLIDTLTKLSEGASVPFLPKARIDLMCSLLNEIGVSYFIDDYCIVAEIPGQKDAPQMMFMSHLDHPGIALKNSTEGVFWGSVGYVKEDIQSLLSLLKIVKTNPAAIKIFSPQGADAGKGTVTGFTVNTKQKVFVDTSALVLENSMAHWDMGPFAIKDDIFHLYSADNDVPTAAMLNALKTLATSDTKPFFNLKFVFNLFEEVCQVSSYYIAKNNTLNLTDRDFIINLECKEIFIDDTEIEKGLVLQIGEIGCLYGYKFSTQSNLAEILVADVCENAKVKVTTGVVKGSCDARPFSNYKLTPNIVTLTVPNKFKHNTAKDNSIMCEQIYVDDINDMDNAVTRLAKVTEDFVNDSMSHKEKSKSLTLKMQGDKVTNLELMKRKKILNNRLNIAYKGWVKGKRVFPTNFYQKAQDAVYKLLSYIKYFFDIITMHA